MLTFNNFRLSAEINNWPIGGKHRGICEFTVVEGGGKRGQRVQKRTTNKDGVWQKPKYSVYAIAYAIADGSDGNTYLLGYSHYGFVSVYRHDFMCAERSGIWDKDADFIEIFDAIKKLN